MKEFEINDIIVIKGMKEGESFDPKVLLMDLPNKPGLRCYIKGLLLNMVQETKPFTGVREMKFLPITVTHPILHPWEEESRANLLEVEKKDFFERKISLTTEEFLWATFSLLSASNNPDLKNPPLLNKGELATYLIETKTITMFQLVGNYKLARGWMCASFNLSRLNEEEKEVPVMNKILLPIV